MTVRPASAAAIAASLALGCAALAAPIRADAADAPIVIGVPTAIEVQVGRDTVDATRMAIDEINASGGVLGRKLTMIVADEGQAATEGPKTGIAAVNKLIGEDHVDVLIGGYDSGVTLAELPHISRGKTIYIDIGSASPAITRKVKDDYDHYRYIFRASPLNSLRTAAAMIDFIKGELKGKLGYTKIAIVGENAKWVQDLMPALKKGAEGAGLEVPVAELFDVTTTDFSPLFAKVRESGAQYLVTILSHASSDAFIKQWHDQKLPMPVGGLDVKSMDADFFKRVDGKAISETTLNFIVRAPLTPKTVPFWDKFVNLYKRAPVYTAAGAYDAVYIYADAVKKAGSTAADPVIKALEQTSYVGVRGRVVFDGTHDVRDGPGLVDALFVQWHQDGARVVVWPKALANGAIIDPPWLKQN